MGVFIGELSALYGAFRAASPIRCRRCRCSTPTTRPGSGVDGGRGAASGRRSTGARRWRARPSCWSCRRTMPRPAQQDFAGGVVDVELDEELTAALKALRQRHGATLFMTLLAGWAAVLARLSGQDDVVVGTPIGQPRAERDRGADRLLRQHAGRCAWTSRARRRWRRLLERVKERALEAQQHQDIPFEQVVELVQPVRSLAHSPLFQVMFAWQNAPEGGLELPGLELDAGGGAGGRRTATAKFDLTLALGGAADGSRAGEYATALFERATVERYGGLPAPRCWRRWRRTTAQPWTGCRCSPRPSGAWWWRSGTRPTRRIPRDACVHELFRAQAARTPEAVALSWRRRAADVRGAGGAGEPARQRAAAPRRGAGGARGHLPGAHAGAGRRAAGRAEGGRRVRAAGPGVPGGAAGATCSRTPRVTLVITSSRLADRLPERRRAPLLLDARARRDRGGNRRRAGERRVA